METGSDVQINELCAQFSRLQTIEEVWKLRDASSETSGVYYKLPLPELLRKTSDKRLQTQIFYDYYKDLPPQGSLAWIQARPWVFGGSEIGTLAGENPYNERRDVFESKLGLSEFQGNSITRWGNVFEDVSSTLSNFLFRTTVESTGSIPGLRNAAGVIMQNYSPDGLAIINKKVLYNTIVNLQGKEFKEYKPMYEFLRKAPSELGVLFEYKCPHTRIPGDEVPKHYRSQPKTGACTIPFVDISVFVDALYLKCSMSDFGMNINYDNDFHDSPRVVMDEDPLLCGFVGIYDDSQVPVVSIKPPATEAEMLLLVQKLIEKMKQEVISPGSDFYQTTFEMKKLMSCISLCDRLCSDVYQETHLLEKFSWSEAQEVELIRRAIVQLLQPKLEEEKLLTMLLEDAVRANYLARHRYNLEDLNYGIDFGSVPRGEFDQLLEKVDDTRKHPAKRGYRAYYPNGFYYSEDMKEYFYNGTQKNAENYVDRTLVEEEQSRKWLYQNVQRFLKWCKEKKVGAVGIIPWKLFRLSVLPVLKEENFLENKRKMIEDNHSLLMQIRKEAEHIPEGPEKTAKYIELLDKYVPRTRKKRTFVPAAQMVPVFDDVSPTISNYSQSLVDDFSSL